MHMTYRYPPQPAFTFIVVLFFLVVYVLCKTLRWRNMHITLYSVQQLLHLVAITPVAPPQAPKKLRVSHPLSSSGWNKTTWNHVQWPYWSAMVLWCQYRKIQINQFLQVYGILVEDILYWCIICMLRQRNVFTQYIYNKEKELDDERDGWLRRIPVCDMHQPISQIILWWCIYQRICIHRSYSLNNTIISIFCFYCIHLKLNLYSK